METRTPARAAGLAILRSKLRKAGLRCTSPRIAVLDRLSEATAPLSHEQIAAHLLPIGFDRATIYRNLADLAEARVIGRVEVGDHVRRYEMRADGATSNHPHFVCG